MVLLNLFLCSTAMTKTLSQMIHFFLMVRSQQWTYVRVVDMKSPSFVCLTSEVRVLFVASCFEVCSQHYGQCLFVSPGPFCLRLSPTKLFGLIPWQPNPVRRSSHYLYRDKINSWEWRLNLILREWSDKLTVLYSPSVITLSNFCDRKPFFSFQHTKAGMCQQTTIKTMNLCKKNPKTHICPNWTCNNVICALVSIIYIWKDSNPLCKQAGQH